MQPDLNQLMRQAQKAQQELEKISQELATTELEGSAGGGAVTIRVTGALEFKAIKLKPEVVDPSDVETLEDLILVAIKDACEKAKQLGQTKQSRVLGGMQMPPGLGF